jgi:hypothetical protein
MFKKIESSGTNSDKPFFDEWVKALDSKTIKQLEGSEIKATSIKEVTSGKGFMVYFPEFSIFVWKKSSTGKALKELFDCEFGNHFGCCLSPTKKGITYELGFFEEEPIWHNLNQPEQDLLTFVSEEEYNQAEKERLKLIEQKQTLALKNEEIRAKAIESIKPKK